jgi:hypothetical protein
MGTPSNEEQFLKLHDMIIGSTNVSGFLTDLSILAASTLGETAKAMKPVILDDVEKDTR